ncbi:MAG: hypothetical protein KR126chlam3_01498, partial [Chlamydiae bacterium]|nr:hypothetical protein [Chlamydiota bacterium]NGX59891.1 hypothetical protein [Chlamydiota bacterium]NGX59997.1 hypothetical protein [Chlamydiota bacterium]NGX60105.1 hypothetical protein [Chlamydiota bacterium]NGX60175.1 hypothetical protein [Chlamydiota bacterium]
SSEVFENFPYEREEFLGIWNFPPEKIPDS